MKKMAQCGGAALTVVIPASNEAEWIRNCLNAVFASQGLQELAVEVIVVANGCVDQTAALARQVIAPPNWSYQVLDLEEGSKIKALNAGDAIATGAIRVYLDADCVVGPEVLAQICVSLALNQPRYAGARAQIPRPVSLWSYYYGRFWQKLPFVQDRAPGFGLYAVNAAGRRRWGAFPDVISDDSFVRLLFTPQERAEVSASYTWPLPEGMSALIRTRRRQEGGLAQLYLLYPQLKHQSPQSGSLMDLARLVVKDPLGFAVYALVRLAVRLRPADGKFTRGR